MFELVLILLLILANGVLAMAEFAIVSSRQARLKQAVERGDEGARQALALLQKPGQFLSTVQIGITLVGILAGAFGGAALAAALAPSIAQLPLLAPYAETLALLLIVAIITFLSLLMGELVPKRLALTNPERIAAVLAPPMNMFARLTSPIVRLLNFCTEAVLALLRVSTENAPTVTVDEVKLLIDEGAAKGVFEPGERELVRRVFRLGDLSVEALMTPRTEIAAIDINDTEEDIRLALSRHNHSRFPVIRGGMDEVLGIVKARDLLAQLLAGRPIDLHAVLQPVLFIPEGTSALDVMERFRQQGTHVALIVDEYGGIQGLVTLYDLMEAVVGDYAVSEDALAPEIVLREDGSWLVDGRLSIHELKDKIGIKTLPEEEQGHYQTVGGLVMLCLGRVPVAGDHFTWDKWRFEVVDMDGRRVDKVLVTPAQVPSTNS